MRTVVPAYKLDFRDGTKMGVGFDFMIAIKWGKLECSGNKEPADGANIAIGSC